MPVKYVTQSAALRVPAVLTSPLNSFSLRPLTGIFTVCYETLCGRCESHFLLHTQTHTQTVSFFQEPVKCKAPGHPENGHSSGEIYTVGAKVTFSCEQGHQLLGATEITCLESGEWNHLIPSCEGVFHRGPVFAEFGNPGSGRYKCVKG